VVEDAVRQHSGRFETQVGVEQLVERSVLERRVDGCGVDELVRIVADERRRE